MRVTDAALPRSAWGAILDEVDTATFGELVEALKNRDRDLLPADPEVLVEAAIASGGPLVEDTSASSVFPEYQLEQRDTGSDEAANEAAHANATSTLETQESSSDEALAAFQAAIDYWHERLDCEVDLPGDEVDTMRDYIRETRGWDDATIDEKRLGWAPAGRDDLLNYLMGEGFDRNAILGTGLFWENSLEPVWQGRFVFPYLVEGKPEFAISRRLGDDGHALDDAGVYTPDDTPAKYHKMPGQDCTVVEEPIYGVDSLESGEDVLITEGIADAITAHEAGYACLSPVTTSFKYDDCERLLALLKEHDVDTVHVVQDAELPTSDVTEDAEGWDALNTEQFGEGVKGASRTAGYLADNDIDARIGRLPQPGARKVDIDDYLNVWANTLAPILASAIPAEQHPAYDSQQSALKAASVEVESAAERSGNGESALFDLDIVEVADVSEGYRGPNPLGHHGDSENYYTVLNGGELGFDHKYKTAYNALTHLLVEAGERRAASPSGPLDDEELLAAWVHAKREGHLGEDDSVPHAALRHFAVDCGLCDRDDFCDGWRIPESAYNEAIAALEEEFGVSSGRDSIGSDRAAEERTTGRDLLDLEVVVEPRNALAAAASVQPEDLERDLPELERNDIDDVAIAVALAEDWTSDPDDFPEDGRYTHAYYQARDHYGAPLPEYLDNSTLEERAEFVFAALKRIKPGHILDDLRSAVTVEDPAGEAVAKLDPIWEHSESGERILAGYGAGFYCVEHGVSFSPIQLVALEHDLFPDDLEGAAREHAYPRGEAFKTAYRLLREEYGAPLPRWRATLLEHVPVLPPTVRLLNDDMSAHANRYSLNEAREATEALLRDAMTVQDRAQLVTASPMTGKTYATAALADDHPILYVTQRNDLKAQMAEYVAEVSADDEHHPDADPTALHLPIFAENTLPDDAIQAGVEAVREHGRDLLRDGDALLEYVSEYIEDDIDAEDHESELDRATCSCAEGEHGVAWAVRVQVAHALGHTPAEIHRCSQAIFGEQIPCQLNGDCRYSLGWERVSDPDHPIDLLIGSPQHARVGSATTYYERGQDGERLTRARAVVVDEFPSEAYFSSYDEHYMDHAVWLAEALVDIDNREDLLGSTLDTDTWIQQWLDGEGDDLVVVADAIDALNTLSGVRDATTIATSLLEENRLDNVAGQASVDLEQVRAAVGTVAEVDPVDSGRIESAAQDLEHAARRLEHDADRAYANSWDGAGGLYDLVKDLEGLLGALGEALDLAEGREDGALLATVRERLNAVEAGGDLRALLDASLDAACGDAPADLIDAAVTALHGGREGCRELALFANDGYAHPDAWALLGGAIADADSGSVRELTTESFQFDSQDGGGRFKRLRRNDATVVADMNHHGALVVDTPDFTDADNRKCPLIGLDATGRSTLWRHAIGRETQQRDIHDSDVERRQFLRETVDLTVVQTTDRPLPYHSDPTGKNFQEDVELVETAAETYTGPDGLDDKGPAVISTLKILNHLEDDLAEHAGTTVNYENMKGSDALADHQVAVVLGSQHYGDDIPEKWALVAGESVGRGDTRGDTLDYGSSVANAYLNHMREDHTMQAILRAGRNDDTTVVVAHTGALRPDLPVENKGAVVSAHSRGALAVAEAAAELRGEAFTARDVAEMVDDTVGLRQVQNVLADFREAGYLRVETEGERGRAYEYDLEEEPGLAEVDLPGVECQDSTEENEISANETCYTWDFVLTDAEPNLGRGGPPGAATIPARATADSVATRSFPPD